MICDKVSLSRLEMGVMIKYDFVFDTVKEVELEGWRNTMLIKSVLIELPAKRGCAGL